MNILAISGSPRIGGNTDTLLDKVLEGAGSKSAVTEKIILNTLKFSPCQECDKAKLRDDGSCIVGDDLQDVYGKIKKADAVVLASPVFFGSLSAQTKMMIDRFQCAWRAKYVLKKPIFKRRRAGFFVCAEASDRKDFFDNAKSIVKNFFAVIGVDYKKELFCPRMEEKEDVLKHPEILRKAHALGEGIVTEGGYGADIRGK